MRSVLFLAAAFLASAVATILFNIDGLFQVVSACLALYVHRDLALRLIDARNPLKEAWPLFAGVAALLGGLYFRGSPRSVFSQVGNGAFLFLGCSIAAWEVFLALRPALRKVHAF